MLKRTIVAVFLALGVAGLWPGDARAQINDPGFATLAHFARTDPQQALDRIDLLLANLETQGDSDPKIVFDLYRLAADLLLQTGQPEKAAQLLGQLAGFAVRSREMLDIDPAAAQALQHEATAMIAGTKSAAPTRGTDGGFREIDVYYATDRARSGEPRPVPAFACPAQQRAGRDMPLEME